MTGVKYRVLLAVALCVTSVAMAACGTDFVETPAAPTPVTITEPPFTGTLTVNGAATYPFVTTASGDVKVVVTSIVPSTDATRISVALGTWNGTACHIIIANDNAFVATVLSGQATAAGLLCVRVSDVGKLTEPVDFELSITHL